VKMNVSLRTLGEFDPGMVTENGSLSVCSVWAFLNRCAFMCLKKLQKRTEAASTACHFPSVQRGKRWMYSAERLRSVGSRTISRPLQSSYCFLEGILAFM